MRCYFYNWYKFGSVPAFTFLEKPSSSSNLTYRRMLPEIFTPQIAIELMMVFIILDGLIMGF